MAFNSVLTVCIGNLCRSPLAEAALRRACPDLAVASAGLHAPEGSPADPATVAAARAHGLDLAAHRARRFQADEAGRHDLILGMEPGHIREILARAPHLGGRVLLLSQWTGGAGIADPYRRPPEAHAAAAEAILAAVHAWATRLVR